MKKGVYILKKFPAARAKWGAMHQKMAIFTERNNVCRGTNFFAGAFILYSERNEQLGGDASENDDFQSEKQRLQGYNCFQELSFYVQKELMNDSFQLCIFWFKISHGESAWRYCIFSF